MSEQRVFLVQCLCPQRHAIAASAYERELKDTERAKWAMRALKHQIEAMIEKRTVNPHCDLCGAKAETWRFEDAPTRFQTVAEAMPHLRRMEEENRRTNTAIRAAQRATRN